MKFSFYLSLVLSIGLLTGWGDRTARADWPQFRGPNSSGIYNGQAVPINFGPGQNVRWSLDLPPGHSSPCIAGHDLYLTGFSKAEKKLEVIAVDTRVGKIRWRRSIEVSQLESGHPSFNPASSSPATDGERVVAYFGSYGLLCFDKDGNRLWDVRLPLTRSYAGNATSPAIIGDKVILYRGNHVDHFVMAVDKRTGKQIWKVPQEEPFAMELACTSCPIAVGNRLILHSARSVQALELDTGKLIWVVKCATTATSTPVVSEDRVIVAAWNKMGEPALRPEFPAFDELVLKHDRDGDQFIGPKEFPKMWIFHRPEGAEAPQNGAPLSFNRVDADRDGKLTSGEWKAQLKRLEAYRAGYQTHGILSIPLNSSGLVDSSNVRTLADQGIPEVPSPVALDGKVYFVKNGGALTCVELATGKRVFRTRTRGKGTHYASPIVVNNRLLTIAGDGKVTVLSLDASPKILATNQMNDRVYATPAVSDGVLYVRTHSKLYAFSQTQPDQP